MSHLQLITKQPLGGSGPITTGDILDDIIHEKFGEDSFVRIDGNPSRSKRRAEIKAFNDKKGGKFVCLMETRACIPSIKLKSIDTVIFFNSDWDPANDLKALQRMSLNSQFEKVKVFRLYSAHTVEEKALMLAKNGMTPEGSLKYIKRHTCHELLAWGAYFLFQKLEDFHAVSATDTGPTDSNGDSFMEEVFQELSALLPNDDKSDVHSKSSLISEVQQVDCVYSTNMSLVGEAEYPLMDNYSVIEEMLINEPPHVFWINILEGRTPSWKYFSSESPRSRKSAHSLDDLPDEYDRPSKKRRTKADTTASQTPTIARRRRRRRTSGFANISCTLTIGPASFSSVCVCEKSIHCIPTVISSWDGSKNLTSCSIPEGEAAAASRMQTPISDKPPSLELPSRVISLYKMLPLFFEIGWSALCLFYEVSQFSPCSIFSVAS